MKITAMQFQKTYQCCELKLIGCEVIRATLRIDILGYEVIGQYRLWSDLLPPHQSQVEQLAMGT